MAAILQPPPQAMSIVPSQMRILICDDQPDVLEALRFLLKRDGYKTESAESPRQALQLLETRDYDAAIIDLNYTRDTTSGGEGLDLLARMQAIDSMLPVIVMTAWGNVEIAVEAMRRGARDFVQKPWDNDRLLTILRNQVDLYRALQHAQRLAAENALLKAEGRPQLVAESPAMRSVLETVTRIAASDANVLVLGEHGTGKEVLAQTIHALSDRASRSLIAVNTGGLSEGVFESELFGHVKGAFTDAKLDRIGRFEMAHQGTIFLDEVGNVPVRQQAKLLRVLQSGELERVGSSRPRQVDVRVISATNVDLQDACKAGLFREDLLFRLNTVEIR